MAASIRKNRLRQGSGGQDRGRQGEVPQPPARRAFRRTLLDWYDRNGRTLPWRETSDPVPHSRVGNHAAADAGRSRAAEVPRVARQISVVRGARRCAGSATSPEPGIRSATTSARSACRRSRARRWRTTAGQLPSDEATLLSFKGIGAYTAGAIRSFAFRERAAILDTNVARVLFRVFIGRGVPKAHATKKHLWSISAALVPRRRAFDFNQALMDFGATLCTARKPKCLICPMASRCSAYPYNPEHEMKHEGPRKPRRSAKND